ncbi:MAG: hypothetical protein FWE34_08185 [Defluviitaleaceae bacterium]|nr:hypothetical protein [Defluviitaleaceae bacterium]
MMFDWDRVRPVVEQVLREARFNKSSSEHYNQPCFLTSYQIAVLVDGIDPFLKGNMPVGGKGVGSSDSLSKKIG